MAAAIARGEAPPKKERLEVMKRPAGSGPAPSWSIQRARNIVQCMTGLKGKGQNKAFNYGVDPTKEDSWCAKRLRTGQGAGGGEKGG